MYPIWIGGVGLHADLRPLETHSQPPHHESFVSLKSSCDLAPRSQGSGSVTGDGCNPFGPFTRISIGVMGGV